jgi:hypothetical protein
MSKYSHRHIQAQHSFVEEGNPKHLSELFSEHSGLYDFLRRSTHNEEAASQAFTRVAQGLADAKYEGDESLFDGWLYRLAVEAIQDNLPNPETPKELQALPPELLEAFLLAHYAKLTPEQLGVALRITSQEATARIERALLMLQEN